MRTLWRHGIALVVLASSFVLLGTVPAPANSPGEPTGEELEASRRLLDRWRRSDPEHYTRLKRDYRDFMALPEERREQLRRLDDQLHDDEPAAQRFWTILDRYTAWIDRLPQEERQRIADTADTSQKLGLIRVLREREWVSHLPRAVRERILRQPEGEARSALIADLRKKERAKQTEWARAIRPPDPIAPLRAQPKNPPLVPLGRLRQFAQHELTREEREALGLAAMNDVTRQEALTREFEKRYPEEAKRLRKARENKKK